jgi:alkanesulfonate monooxygenase SsuD/methylene tetrahydromethanopterin reductase-like flavin-dependent oxidoreductase (luciferase family)
MRLGVHLPLADLAGGGAASHADLVAYTREARDLGFATVSANDHLFWRHPWLDGPTALASVISAAGDMAIATSVILPVVRHPVVVAKTLTTLATLARGPVIGGLGPGSSRTDHDAVGVPFEERWARFDEAMRCVTTLVRGEPGPAGRFYRATPVLAPVAEPRPQIWLGTWGSDRRIAATAPLADGWLASAYNATPDQYAAARGRLDGHLRNSGREPSTVPDAVATAWLHVSESPAEAEHVITDVLAPTLGRDPAELRHLPIGSPEHCAQALAAYAAAGAREVLLWPLRDPILQLQRIAAAVPMT